MERFFKISLLISVLIPLAVFCADERNGFATNNLVEIESYLWEKHVHYPELISSTLEDKQAMFIKLKTYAELHPIVIDEPMPVSADYYPDMPEPTAPPAISYPLFKVSGDESDVKSYQELLEMANWGPTVALAIYKKIQSQLFEGLIDSYNLVIIEYVLSHLPNSTYNYQTAIATSFTVKRALLQQLLDFKIRDLEAALVTRRPAPGFLARLALGGPADYASLASLAAVRPQVLPDIYNLSQQRAQVVPPPPLPADYDLNAWYRSVDELDDGDDDNDDDDDQEPVQSRSRWSWLVDWWNTPSVRLIE